MGLWATSLFNGLTSHHRYLRFMESKQEIVTNWIYRYTGVPAEDYGDWILLTNFKNYVEKFAQRFDVPIHGNDRSMTVATNSDGLSIINFGMGSANAATVMDLLSAVKPKGVLFLGKCGGVKRSTELGHFILPIAAIRGEGTGDDYMRREVPALPSFKLHKYVSQILVDLKQDYRTGVIYTTNRRVWEHDEKFKQYLREIRVLGVDMETATIFITGLANEIPRGALLLVSDLPMIPEGVKTEELDKSVTRAYVDLHLDIGIRAMTEIGEQGEAMKHFSF
jgi:AMP nucleosidase